MSLKWHVTEENLGFFTSYCRLSWPISSTQIRIVLASSNNKFIVGAPARLLKEPDIQALAISGSKETEVLEKSDRAGSGLLSLEKKYNGFGLFLAVFVDKKVGVEVGTKLIIERRRK